MGKKIIRLTESDLEKIVYRVLSEQSNTQTTYGQCNGNNQTRTPKVKVVVRTKNEDNTVPDNVRFKIIAYFDSTKSSEQVYKDSLVELKKQVDKELRQSNIIGRYKYNLVRVSRIIGSASNYLNGPLKPTVDNKGIEIPKQKLNQEPYVNLPGEGDSKWNKNMEYAKNRWTNMLNYIKSNGGSLGFEVDASLSDPSNIQSFIKDTGGCIDEKRDINKYPTEGQAVLVEGMMKLEPIELTPGDIDDLLECADGLRIVVGYFESAKTIDGIDFPKNKKTHTCNYATFDILCNGEPIGISNMNNNLSQKRTLKNGEKIYVFNEAPKAQIGKNQSGYNPPTKSGGSVFTVINVPTDKLKSIIGRSKNGKIKMSIRGNSESLNRRGEYHGDAPMVCAFVLDKDGNKRIVYGPKEPFGATGNVGPEERSMGSFNPCIETKVIPA